MGTVSARQPRPGRGPWRPQVNASPDLDRLARQYVDGRKARGELARTTIRNMRFSLMRFTEAVAVDRPTAMDVDRWLQSIGHLQPRTRQKEISDVKGFCAWLVTNGHLDTDPMAGVRRPRTPRATPKALPAADVGRALAACPDSRARLILTLMVHLGLRRGEVAALQADDIDQQAGTVRVTGKGGHTRVLPLVPEAAQALAAYLADDPAPAGGPLIRSQLTGQGIGAARVAQIVVAVMTDAGVKLGPGDGRASHALRHTCAVDVLRAGAVLTEVQAMLGHSSVATTAVYLPADPKGLAGVMAGRDYSGQGPAGAVEAAGPLVEAVAALAATVAELRAELARRDHPTPPAAGEEMVRCGLCGASGRAAWMAVRHRAEDHCPDCGRHDAQHTPGRLARHRLEAHGVPFAAGCPWDVPHDHTSTGHCACPLCGQTSLTLVWGTHTMADHLARPHRRCPDCDRAFINLSAHRRRAHPWA